MKSYKSLTYNRFRAYLRVKLKNKHFSKKRLIFAILFYFLCSLTIFLLPLDILTKYPYLKYFTDFMDFIPAIKLMESKTFAPELCKFYASYMLVAGIIYFLWAFVCYCYIAFRQGFLSIYHHTKEAQKVVKRLSKFSKKFIILSLIGLPLLFGFGLYGFLNGGMIGYTRRGHWNTYFIDDYFEMIFYIDFWQGFMVCFGIPYMFCACVAISYLYFRSKQ
ncbi:hypothetical protein [uncultured Helicobacter sp.]|uniref:hypothetical protein n=1 Tax=uncultured Helicobacter sp. TaxID=175537 RepID=UPI0026098D7C|nr:hypothetical protein [uncultured Helicobacter sp.]